MKIKLIGSSTLNIKSEDDLTQIIPVEYKGSNLNYGQGEGQFSINETEWGIYLYDYENYVLQFEKGSLSFSETTEIAVKIIKKN